MIIERLRPWIPPPSFRASAWELRKFSRLKTPMSIPNNSSICAVSMAATPITISVSVTPRYDAVNSSGSPDCASLAPLRRVRRPSILLRPHSLIRGRLRRRSRLDSLLPHTGHYGHRKQKRLSRRIILRLLCLIVVLTIPWSLVLAFLVPLSFDRSVGLARKPGSRFCTRLPVDQRYGGLAAELIDRGTTVVSAGDDIAAISILSEPTTLRSSGTESPWSTAARNMPSAIRSLNATTAVIFASSSEPRTFAPPSKVGSSSIARRPSAEQPAPG